MQRIRHSLVAIAALAPAFAHAQSAQLHLDSIAASGDSSIELSSGGTSVTPAAGADFDHANVSFGLDAFGASADSSIEAELTAHGGDFAGRSMTLFVVGAAYAAHPHRDYDIISQFVWDRWVNEREESFLVGMEDGDSGQFDLHYSAEADAFNFHGYVQSTTVDAPEVTAVQGSGIFGSLVALDSDPDKPGIQIDKDVHSSFELSWGFEGAEGSRAETSIGASVFRDDLVRSASLMLNGSVLDSLLDSASWTAGEAGDRQLDSFNRTYLVDLAGFDSGTVLTFTGGSNLLQYAHGKDGDFLTSQVLSSGSSDLSIEVVPEPASAMVVLAGLLLFRRRNRS